MDVYIYKKTLSTYRILLFLWFIKAAGRFDCSVKASMGFHQKTIISNNPHVLKDGFGLCCGLLDIDDSLVGEFKLGNKFIQLCSL